MKKNRRKKERNSEPRFVFTKNGLVQLWDQQGRKGMLVASTLADAEKFVVWMRASRGEKLTIEEVGTVDGITIKVEFKWQVAAGADCLCLIQFDGDELYLQPLLSTDWTIPFGGWLGSDQMHPISIESLFDETWTGPNQAKDPRRTVADAQLIIGIDVMSQQQFLVYGRKILEEILKTGVARKLPTLFVALDQETDELEKLVALVQVVKGYDDYQADEVVPLTPGAEDGPKAKTNIVFSDFRNLTSESDEVRDATLRELREADVILAANKGIPPFYGKQWLEEVAAGKIDETAVTKMVVIGLDADRIDQQVRELRQIVVELRGSCCYEEEPCLCMFINIEGQIQHWVQDGTNRMVVAATREMAKMFGAWLKRYKGQNVSIVEIGSVQGETFDTSVEMGTNCVWCLGSIDGDRVVCNIWKPLP